ncbi:uracil-DNA glycosylase [Christensenellaceae bacterium]|nr:uracil-DNA glycosylase [Christensenellaceae bacterium]BDF62198.1 uracil-DNA glycosylase [Christensenellaceae bacterium]
MYDSFKTLYETVMHCKKCKLWEKRTHVVFGEGNLKADIMFVGEGPGAREDELGRPFVGPAGQLLDKMLCEIGLKRADVYIANVVKCRPPNNRDPQEDERQACMDYLRAQVAFIKPKLIVCLGRIAAGVILKRDVKMMKEHGTCIAVKDFMIMPTFHPAAMLHNPDYVESAKEDFRVLRQKLEELHIAE